MNVKNNQPAFYKKAYLYFTLALFVTVIGFFKSYFTRLSHTDFSHHFHGIVATSWMILLIIEPFLYSTGNLKWHRRLGKCSFLLIPLVILSALKMIHTMIHSQASYPPFVVYQLAFLDFFYIFQFILFYILAIVQRKQIQYHARYMAATVFIFVLPALGRLFFFFPGVSSFDISLNLSYLTIEVILILLLLDDKRSGKIRLPYLLALSLFATQHLLLNYVANWDWWRWLIDMYATLNFG